MGMMDSMMGVMLGRMKSQEKERMMASVMDRFLADMGPQDRHNMMAAMMPRMMLCMLGEGACCASDTMFGTGQDSDAGPGAMMPEMMIDMMPHCLGMLLPRLPGEKRAAFVLKMVDTLIEQGAAGLSADERKDLADKIAERVTG